MDTDNKDLGIDIKYRQRFLIANVTCKKQQKCNTYVKNISDFSKLINEK